MKENLPGRRIGRWLLAIVVVLVVLLMSSLWVNEGPLWILVMTRRQPVRGTFHEGDLTRVQFSSRLTETHAYQGWERVHRWGPKRGQKHGPARGYYVENGRLAFDAVHKNDEIFRYTRWNLDGSVNHQVTTDPTTSVNLGVDRERRPPTTLQRGFSVSDGVLVKERRSLPPWWWGVTDQVPPPDGAQIRRFVPTGLKISEKVWEGGKLRRVTSWHRDGTVYRQAKYIYQDGAFLYLEFRAEPPWWWGVTDQALPSTEGKTTVKSLTQAYSRPTTEVNGNPVRGFATFVSTPAGDLQHGTTIEFYAANGQKAREFEYQYGSLRQRTIWRLDGSIQYQQDAKGNRRRDPPYWWGKKPETEPSAPWWKPRRP